MPPTCVIVDDSQEFLAASRAMLEREGVTVLGVASTSAEALERVQALQPELVLVDIDLGAENGLDLTERLASLGKWRVVLMSVHAQADFAELVEASPAIGFVAKSELSAGAIRALLRGTAGQRMTQ